MWLTLHYYNKICRNFKRLELFYSANRKVGFKRGVKRYERNNYDIRQRPGRKADQSEKFNPAEIMAAICFDASGKSR